MNGSIIFWVIIVLVLFVLWVLHIRKCWKYINSVAKRSQQERGTGRRVVQTITIPVGMPPYLITNDIERGGQASERKIDRELPTYEEAMEEDMRRVVNQTNVSSNPPPRY